MPLDSSLLMHALCMTEHCRLGEVSGIMEESYCSSWRSIGTRDIFIVEMANRYFFFLSDRSV